MLSEAQGRLTGQSGTPATRGLLVTCFLEKGAQGLRSCSVCQVLTEQAQGPKSSPQNTHLKTVKPSSEALIQSQCARGRGGELGSLSTESKMEGYGGSLSTESKMDTGLTVHLV